MTYGVVRALARSLLAVFYRRIEVHGLPHVPPAGPLLVVANHHNGLVDPMLLLAVVPRRLTPLAKAPLFRHPIFAPFLYLVGALPVDRRQDAGGDPARNARTLERAARGLASGGAVMIFPEGASQATPVVMPLRTGAARLARTAASLSPDGAVTLLPVGLVFHRPGEFRLGRALVVVGAPIRVAGVPAGGADAPEAVRALTDRIRDALRALIVEAEDRRTLRLLDVAHKILRDAPPDSDLARLTWMREAMSRWRTLPPAAQARVEAVRRELERFDKDAAPAPAGSYRSSVVARWIVREGSSLVLGLPLALWGVLTHGLPYQAVGRLVRWLRPDPDTEATYKLTAGFVLFPLAWLAEAATLWALGGGRAVALFVLLLVPSGFFALTWQYRLARARRELRAFVVFLADRDVPARLEARRRWLRAELVALAAAARS